MNFSKEGAQSEKVHQVKPRIKNLYLEIFISTVQPFQELLGGKKMILPINGIIVANVDGLE